MKKRLLVTITGALLLSVSTLSAKSVPWEPKPSILIAYAKKQSKKMGIDPKYALAILKAGKYKAQKYNPAVGMQCNGVMRVCELNALPRHSKRHPEDNRFWKKNSPFSDDFFGYKKSITTGIKLLSYCLAEDKNGSPKATLGECMSFMTGITSAQEKELNRVHKGK